MFIDRRLVVDIGLTALLFVVTASASAQSDWKALLDQTETPITWGPDGSVTELESVPGGNLAAGSVSLPLETWELARRYSVYPFWYWPAPIGLSFWPSARVGVMLPLHVPVHPLHPW